MAALSVLIVGAGPTGLTLAAQLQRHGLRFRIVDKVLGGPTMHLLLCGSPHRWDDDRVKLATTGRDALVRVSRLTRESMTAALIDNTGEASDRLAVDDTAQYLIRPDGHIAYRCAGTDLTGVLNYLDYWFPGKHRRQAASSQV